MRLPHAPSGIQRRCDDGEDFHVELVERLKRQEFVLKAYQRIEQQVDDLSFLWSLLTLFVGLFFSHYSTSEVESTAPTEAEVESRSGAMSSISSQETTWQPA